MKGANSVSLIQPISPFPITNRRKDVNELPIKLLSIKINPSDSTNMSDGI